MIQKLIFISKLFKLIKKEEVKKRILYKLNSKIKSKINNSL